MMEERGLEGMRFDILKAIPGNGAAARLGRLALPQRQAIDTPNFFAVTSRGVVPHLTPDTIAKYGSFPGVYMAMEDCELEMRSHPYLWKMALTHAALQWLKSHRNK